MDIRIVLSIFSFGLSLSVFAMYYKLYVDYVIKQPLKRLIKERLLINLVATVGFVLLFLTWSIWQPGIWNLFGVMLILCFVAGFLVMPGINHELIFVVFPKLRKRQ